MKSSVILKVDSMATTDDISKDTKYINFDISSVNDEIVNYFINNGNDFYYTADGFIYATYDVFYKGEEIIKEVLSGKDGLKDIELVRYLYISLGKIVSSSMEDNRLSNINNIWESLVNRKVNNISLCKLFSYLLKRVNIDSEIINNSLDGNLALKVHLKKEDLILDLYNDLYNIQGGFKTKYFDKYNDNINIDKKVNYISDNYMDYYTNEALKELDSNNILEDILRKTETMLDINNIGTDELAKIYKDIFDKYARGYDIKISNLFVCGIEKEPFIVFSYDDKLYSYNYKKGCFILVNSDILLSNFNDEKIGFYSEEDYLFKEKGMVV